jgi:hypothetical protein
MATPSQAQQWEGVETRRQGPKAEMLWLWHSPESKETYTNL